MKQCNDPSPVNIALKVIGGKWKPLILWHLHGEPRRFSELLRSLDGITQKMLTQQLRQLEADGLISRHVYPQIPPKVEYSLTEYGRTLEPALQALAEWGRTHAHTHVTSDSRLELKPVVQNAGPLVVAVA